MKRQSKRMRSGVATLAVVALLFCPGCDPQLQTTVENGIITSSTSLIGAVLRAVIALGLESTSSTTTTGS